MMGTSAGANWIAAIPIIAMLASCSIGPAQRSYPRTYLLNPQISFKKLPVNPERADSATLLISLPNAQAGFDTPRMAYLLRPHELSYFALNEWADTPARMFHSLLVQTMERTGVWRAVVQAPSAVRPDYRLDCDNLVLEQQFFSPSRVRLALRAQLVNIKRQIVMDARDFEFLEDAPSENAYGGVIAANLAAAKLLEQLGQWVVTARDENTKATDDRDPITPAAARRTPSLP
jgi:cholesterol transport system auxiliary component